MQSIWDAASDRDYYGERYEDLEEHDGDGDGNEGPSPGGTDRFRCEGGSVMATETWWYHDAYCDWAPIRPHPTRPCLGGCGTQIDGIDDFCLRCGKAKQETK